ncbi:uncharacterized protein LOC120014137 [Tripterygium wilfordii]|uniref:uncharacterized protein LOC120014137 n=1 Tax=Tripterygium wilfordii TaxID=458696 RepID=UPI0018F8447E|nr:uncharacterized protein LOC120014137 [Tripterygium wilfordii]
MIRELCNLCFASTLFCYVIGLQAKCGSFCPVSWALVLGCGLCLFCSVEPMPFRAPFYGVGVGVVRRFLTKYMKLTSVSLFPFLGIPTESTRFVGAFLSTFPYFLVFLGINKCWGLVLHQLVSEAGSFRRMPPRKRGSRNTSVGGDQGRGDMTRLTEQVASLTQQMFGITAALQELRLTRQPQDLEVTATEGSEGELDNPFAEERPGGRQGEVNRGGAGNHWEAGIRVDIPEFTGGLCVEEFTDWLYAVDEVLEFKEVPSHKQVALVATRLRGHVAAWWQQFKAHRARQGKQKIESWEKMKKNMRDTFLPYNYVRTIYQQLQNLRMGVCSVDDYTAEFYQLIARNDLTEMEEQLVSRYVGGMRVQFQDILNMFDIFTVAEAYQRAKQLENRLSKKSGDSFWEGSRVGRTPSNLPNIKPGSSGSVGEKQVISTPTSRAPSTGFKCFKCGEPGNRASDFRKGDRGGKALLVEPDNEGQDEFEGELEYDPDGKYDLTEELVQGDRGTSLVVRRSCYTPRVIEGEDWIRSVVFQSTCTIGDKVCSFIIDSGSCENVVAEEVIQKLGLKVEEHSKPYGLAWIQKGAEVKVSKRCKVCFSVGLTYKDQIWCDVVSMDACHLLLGRPWQYDRRVIQDGRKNTYSFIFESTKIVLLPSQESKGITSSGDKSNLLSHRPFEKALSDSSVVYMLISKEVMTGTKIPAEVRDLLIEFGDVFPEDLPIGLPLLRDVQHRIDLIPGSVLPNRPHYRMSPREHEELRRQVEELLGNGYIRESLSPCVVPALLTPKKDGSWRMCVDSRAINKITTRYRFPIPRLDDLLDQLTGAAVFSKLDLKSGYH